MDISCDYTTIGRDATRDNTPMVRGVTAACLELACRRARARKNASRVSSLTLQLRFRPWVIVVFVSTHGILSAPRCLALERDSGPECYLRNAGAASCGISRSGLRRWAVASVCFEPAR